MVEELRAVIDSDSTPRLVPLAADFSSLAEVEKLAESFINLQVGLDCILCAAGVATIPDRKETADGFELQFGVNHLAHFRLVDLLLPTIRSSRGRVVLVSTDRAGLKRAKFHFDDLQAERSYSMFGAYVRSKLANVLHAKELHERECSHGVAAVSCTPGTVADTGIARNLGPGMRWMFRYMGPGLFSRSVAEGGATLAHCMCVPDVVCGGYYENCHVVDNLEGSMADGALAKRLWEASIDLVSRAK